MGMCAWALRPLLRRMFRPYLGHVMDLPRKSLPVPLCSADGTASRARMPSAILRSPASVGRSAG